MAKKELDFLDKYCKTKKIGRESYEPFCDLIVKLHDCNTSASTVFWRNVNNLNDMKTYQYKYLNITTDEKIEIIKTGFNHLIEGNGWITKTKVLSLYKNNPVFNIDTYPFFIEADNPYYKSSASMKLYLVGMIEKFISIKLISLLVKEYGLNKDELENLNNEKLLQIYNEESATIVDEELERQKLLNKQRKLDKNHEKELFFQDNIERFLVSKYSINNNQSLPKRLFECYLGNTNSGKTYTALEKVKQIIKDNPNANIAYLAPLRLLALEIYEKLNSENIPCSLSTGEEEIIIPNAQIKSCTIEMLNENEHYDLIIVDEYQMYNDPQRGGAWYKTFINANCEHFILIGAENALFGLVYLMNRLSGAMHHSVESKSKFTNIFNKNILPFEPVFKIHYFKRICPITYHQPIELKDFQSGDCLVTFSKNKVLQYADLLKELGYKVSILYGDLPLETRIAQSDNFKNGLTDVLVSTDVIGMGLNLPIKRLIFETMDKFDGEYNRTLTKDEFKQIAGRSGRYQQTGEVAYLNASGLGYSPYYRCIVFTSKQRKKLNLNFNMDYDFDDFDDIYSDTAYPLKRYIWDKTQIQSVLDEMNTSSEIMIELSNQEFIAAELLKKLSQSNYQCYQFTVGLNIPLLEEYKNKFKLGFASAYKDYVNFIIKELNDYCFGIRFKDNTLRDTLKHFNQIFKKNGFDCEVAIGLCQAPVNEDLEEEYMAILSMMFNQYSENKLLQDWDKLGKISVNYANNLYRMMQQSSINDPDVGILERMMIANAWLHKKIKKIACIQEQNSESSEMIKDIRKNFAKEIQIKISQKLIADQLFTKCKSLFHKEYNDFELKIKPLSKEINKFNNRCGELKNKIKKAKKAKQYDEKKLYEKELDDLMKNNGNIEATKKEVDRFKKEQFDFINQKVMQELKKYY